MPTGWRIVKSRLASSAFDGEGARLHGGRWNRVGTPMIYTAASESLAMLEVLVHRTGPQLLESYSLIAVEFPPALVEPLDADGLPEDWRASPAPAAPQEIGERWISAQRSAVLAVPSAIVPRERVYLLNPRHPDFGELPIGQPREFRFDPRLSGR